jgi:hypothetical protein
MAQNILDAVREGVSGWRCICVQSADALLCLAVLGSIPLFMDEVFRQMDMSLDMSFSPRKSKFCIIFQRTLVLAVLLLVALLLGTDFADVLSLVGAMSMSWLGCILPGLFYVRFAKKMGSEMNSNAISNDQLSAEDDEFGRKNSFKVKSFDGVLTLGCAVCGFAGMICGTYESVSHMVNG